MPSNFKGRKRKLAFALSLIILSISTNCNAFSFIHSKPRTWLQSTKSNLRLETSTSTQMLWQRESGDGSACASSTVLMMGKGDDKKKKKKKKASVAAPSSAIEVSTPAPLRVTSDSNVSVRRQIQWGRMNKEYRNSGTAFRQTNVRAKSSYRKSLGECVIPCLPIFPDAGADQLSLILQLHQYKMCR